MDPQYIGLFGPQPLDDDYLLTDFLNGNPQQSLKQQQQQHHHHQNHSRSSQESSPSYPSSESAGSINSSGGSPYDYHSPPSNYHFDASNAAAHDLSGGYVMGISPKQISQEHASSGGPMRPQGPAHQQQGSAPQGYVPPHSWDSNMSNGSMMETPRALYGPHNDNYMSATGYPHLQQQVYQQHHHPQSYPAHGMNPQAFSGVKYASYQQHQQQQNPLMYSMPHFPQSNYWSPPIQATENGNSNMLGLSQNMPAAAEPQQQLKRRRVSTYDNGAVSSSASSTSLQDQQQQAPLNEYGQPTTQSLPSWPTSAPQSSAPIMPNVSMADQEPSAAAGATVDASKSKPPVKKPPVNASANSQTKEEPKTTAAPSAATEVAPMSSLAANKGRGVEHPQEDDGEENGPTGHNAVEKRYRTKINSSLTTLQSLIPALAHLKESDDLPSTSRKASAFILSAPQMTALPAGTKIDGVEAPSKLSKGIIIDKGIEYIAVLKDERFDLQTSLSVAEQIISEIPNGRALYDARLQHARAMAAADHKRRDSLSGSPPEAKMSNKRKAMMGVFGGVGLFGAGAAVPSWSDASDQAAASGNAWAGASHLAKRASETALPGPAAQYTTFGSSLGMVAIAAWLVVFAYYIGQALAGALYTSRPQLETASARDDALRVLSRDEQPSYQSKYRSASVSEAARRRYALLVLSQAAGWGTLFCGVVGSLAQGLVSYSHRWIKHAPIDVNDPIEVEKVAALVRLTELETAFGPRLCHRVQRLHSVLRLHNAFVRMPKTEKDLASATPELAAPRIEATLSLALVSIFSSQASKLSRRRRFWQQATAPPADEKAAASLDPWLQVALCAEYEEACTAAFEHNSYSTVASPSDYCPLLRVAEHRCIKQLTNIWARMFVGAIQRANSGDFKNFSSASFQLAEMPFDDGQAGRKIDQILASTVKGSPVQQLAILTRGFWSLGTGDIQAARQHAAVLLTDLRQGGQAAEFASIPIFINLMLPFSTGLHEASMRKPKSTSVDSIALASLEWLSLRRQYTKLPEGSIDARFYDSTLTFRKILNNPSWSAADVQKGSLRESFFSAQSACIQLVEMMGRRAAGMSLPCDLPTKDHDSGSEESG